MERDQSFSDKDMTIMQLGLDRFIFVRQNLHIMDQYVFVSSAA